MINKVLIIGISDLAELAYYYFKNDTQLEVVGFAVDKNYISKDTLFELRRKGLRLKKKSEILLKILEN